MTEIVSILFDASMGMDINPGFWFTSQGLDSSVRREKERSEQNPFSPTITNGSSGC
jgi:hypothetical protein